MKKTTNKQEKQWRKYQRDFRRLRQNKRSTRAGEYGTGRQDDRQDKSANKF